MRIALLRPHEQHAPQTKLLLRKSSIGRASALAAFAGVTDEDHRKYFTGMVYVEVTPTPPHSPHPRKYNLFCLLTLLYALLRLENAADYRMCSEQEISTPAGYEKVRKALRNAKTIGVDCEGVKLSRFACMLPRTTPSFRTSL